MIFPSAGNAYCPTLLTISQYNSWTKFTNKFRGLGIYSTAKRQDTQKTVTCAPPAARHLNLCQTNGKERKHILKEKKKTNLPNENKKNTFVHRPVMYVMGYEGSSKDNNTHIAKTVVRWVPNCSS